MADTHADTRETEEPIASGEPQASAAPAATDAVAGREDHSTDAERNHANDDGHREHQEYQGLHDDLANRTDADADANGDAAADDLVWVCRSAELTRPAYYFYRDLLLSFPRYGRAPTMTELAALVARYGLALHATLTQFAVQDLVQRDPATGAIRAAYPFSGVPTAHHVHLEATPEQPAVELYAMCAIDALGIPLMLRRAATITSADGLTGELVCVSVVPSVPDTPAPERADDEHWSACATWDPAEAVVVAHPEDHEHERGVGDADSCCPIINFFRSADHAQRWAQAHTEAHPDGEVRVYSQGLALRRAAANFAGLLGRLPIEAAAAPSTRERPGEE